jgi:hypothetical protein
MYVCINIHTYINARTCIALLNSSIYIHTYIQTYCAYIHVIIIYVIPDVWRGLKPFKKFGAYRAAVLHSHPQRLGVVYQLFIGYDTYIHTYIHTWMINIYI